jgi:cyclophilin family peptidyl-prolyl cis-trans isomerase
VGQVLAVDVEKVRGGAPWAHLLQGEKDPQRAAVTDVVWLALAVNGTALGRRLEIGLFGKRCPKTAANFKALCRGDTKSSTSPGRALAFKGSAFHRIIPGFMLQGGDITAGDGTGGESIYGPKVAHTQKPHLSIYEGVRQAGDTPSHRLSIKVATVHAISCTAFAKVVWATLICLVSLSLSLSYSMRFIACYLH